LKHNKTKKIMNYILTGSLGHISKPLAERLIAAGHKVTIISSKEEKRKDIEALGATPAIGSVEDVDFLSKTFRGAEAAYTMVPPVHDAKDWKKHIAEVGNNYAQAIRGSGVRYVVNLSSMGAHLPDGVGPVSGLFQVEKALNDLPDVNVLHLRPGYFYSNFLEQTGLIQHMGIMGGNFGDGTDIIMSHTNDIAEAAANELLQLTFKGKSVRYVSSDENSTDEIAKEIGASIKKPDLKWVDFSDEENHAGLLQAGLPEQLAKNYTEMGASMRSGEMFADYRKQHASPDGKIKLHDFAKEFAGVYNELVIH
jgi:uncharacterized protein YbjT (DUF2867 family)